MIGNKSLENNIEKIDANADEFLQEVNRFYNVDVSVKFPIFIIQFKMT